MGVVLLPQKFLSQPQHTPRLAAAYQNAEMLSLFNDGSGKDIAKGNHLIPGVAPTPAIRSHGKSLAFNGSTQYLVSTRTVTPTPAFTVFAWVRPTVLNTTYARIIETDYTSGFYLGANTGTQYAWIVNNSSLEGCIGGQQVIGQRDFVCGVFDGTNRILYVNGIQVASNTATAPSAALTVSISRWATGGGYFWNGDIDTVGIFNKAFLAAEIWSLYHNPWQLFKAPARRLWAVPAAGGTTHDLTGAPSTQANTSSTAGITQTHLLTSDASTEANVGIAAAVTQTHVLAGANSNQADASSTGTITQTQVLTVSTSSQNGTLSAVAITQFHVLSGPAATQGNLGGTGAISVISEFIGAPSTQGNIASTGQITRTQTLTGAHLTQANLLSTGAISDGIVVETALTTGIAATIRIKKPGIPAGTPEWLKTLLETIIGRRGNRIEIPKFRILTFSVTPTKTECEALYTYTNTVRDSLEQLINRMDS